MFNRIAMSVLAVVGALATGSCTPARAQPIDAVVAPPPPCSDGVVWHRSADITFCATTCTPDIECASGERCRVLDEDQKPEDGPLYAEDIQIELVAALAEVAAAKLAPQFDEEPVCEGDCAPYTGDLEIKPMVPLALCDPFHDVAGAMLSAAEEEAIAAQASVAD